MTTDRSSRSSGNQSVNEPKWSPAQWLADYRFSRADMNTLIMDYLVTEGYKEAAEKFRDEAELDYPISSSSSSLDARIEIRKTIEKGRIRDAIAMINDIHPELLDSNQRLHFLLLQQELIELIRSGATEAALTFAQHQLAEKGENDQRCLAELERTLALLVFEKPEQSPFADLLNVAQREKVASEVNGAILAAEYQSASPRLEKLVKMVVYAQDQLDKKRVIYPRMVDFGNATLQPPKTKLS